MLPSENKIQQAMLQQLANAVIEIPFNKMLGLRLDQLTPDHVIMSFDMKNDLIGNFLHGILHGGVISSVLDMAGGMVVMASLINKYPDHSIEDLTNVVGKCSTIDLHISYLKAGKGNLFNAKAFLTKSGNKVSFTRMDLFNDDETLIATGNGTYLLR